MHYDFTYFQVRQVNLSELKSHSRHFMVPGFERDAVNPCGPEQEHGVVLCCGHPWDGEGPLMQLL